MSSLVIAGDTSGTVTLQAPAVAGSTVLTLPIASDTLIGKNTADTLTNKTLTSPIMEGTPSGVGVLTSGTAVTASGTAVDFTGIPSWVKRITVMFDGISTNGTSNQIIQIGDSGGIENTGYAGVAFSPSATYAAYTNGFRLMAGGAAADVYNGVAKLVLMNQSTNLWTFECLLGFTSSAVFALGQGNKSLSGALDRIRITTVNGTDTFDAGSVNIMYE